MNNVPTITPDSKILWYNSDTCCGVHTTFREWQSTDMFRIDEDWWIWCVIPHKWMMVLLFPVISNQAHGLGAFPRKRKHGIIRNIFRQCAAEIPSRNKNVSELFGNASTSHCCKLSSRINEFDKLGDVNTNGSPIYHSSTLHAILSITATYCWFPCLHMGKLLTWWMFIMTHPTRQSRYLMTWCLLSPSFTWGRFQLPFLWVGPLGLSSQDYSNISAWISCHNGSRPYYSK